MREIKFRAWDRKAKAMFPVHNMEFGKIGNSLERLYGVDIHHKDSDFEGDISFGGNVNKMTGNPLQQRFELMQYTGLKDKHGKEIFEGDITFGEHAFYSIFWDDRMSQFKAKIEKTDSVLTKGCSFPLWQYVRDNGNCRIEVIGNIYDNPELLEATP